MPKPQTQVPVQQPIEPLPSEDPTAQRVAEILLAGYAAAKTIKLIAALLKVRRNSVAAALGIATHAHAARSRLKVNGIAPRSPEAKLIERIRNDDIYYRAAYVANASKRIDTRVDEGSSPKDATHDEQPNYDAHRRARNRRLDAAAETAETAKVYGPLLGWYRDPDSESDADCIAANGNNYYAAEGTIIGFPGAVHPNCHCSAGPPHENGEMVNDVIARIMKPTDERRVA